jgi:hypothetical protein
MLFLWPFFTVILAGFVCIVPLFLFAILFYTADEPSTRRTLAVVLASVGLGASVYFCAVVIYPFLVIG